MVVKYKIFSIFLIHKTPFSNMSIPWTEEDIMLSYVAVHYISRISVTRFHGSS
ncbi:hypothetical protein HanRHA438_Chr04g0199961 [Helianthus annuus]|nr:hypothetical protein HanRHA438_Chr04g0199961 [Helianthus annuus]